MKKILKISVLLLAMGLILGLVGCEDEPEENKGPPDETVDIDYTNYGSSSYSVLVKNDSNKKLVAFKGPPSASSLISGIPSTGGQHGLKKDNNLFSSSTDFVLWLLTEEDYLQYKDNVSAMEARPFTRIYAYYNSNSPNPLVYNISGVLGGDKKIVLQNSTSYNVELRRNGIQGEIIGYTGAQTYNTTFFVEPGDYMIFPVFRKYNTAVNEIMSAHPEYGAESPLAGRARFIEFALDNATNEVTIDANSFVGSGFKISAGAAFLVIQNNNTSGIGLWDGLTRQTTESGGQVINPNRSMTFPVYMEKQLGETDRYLETRTMGGFRIGTSARQEQVPSFEFHANKYYQVIISGDVVTAGTVVISEITETGEWSF